MTDGSQGSRARGMAPDSWVSRSVEVPRYLLKLSLVVCASWAPEILETITTLGVGVDGAVTVTSRHSLSHDLVKRPPTRRQDYLETKRYIGLSGQTTKQLTGYPRQPNRDPVTTYKP